MDLPRRQWDGHGGDRPQRGIPGSGTHLLRRRTVADLLELGEPVGEVEPTTILGRDAWCVTLAPVDDADLMRELVVDVATGLVLRQHDPSADGVDEWAELAVGEPLDVTLFTFGGPARSAEEARSGPQRGRPGPPTSRRTRPTATVGVPGSPGGSPLPRCARKSWSTSRWCGCTPTNDRTGAFEASLEVRGGSHAGGSLTRRPRSAAPWPLR